MTPNQLPPLPEPDGQMTVTFGLDEKRKVPVFFGDRLTAYALAAIAQQAQVKPFAYMADDVADGVIGDQEVLPSAAIRGAPGGTFNSPLYTTPPAPQPAPVDERSEFEASMREKHGWVASDFHSDSFGYFDGHTATAWLAWQARAAPQTKGQP